MSKLLCPVGPRLRRTPSLLGLASRLNTGYSAPMSAIPWNGKDQEVQIAPYDPIWLDRFRSEVPELEQALGPWLSGGIHHIGSTSVPGLSAKPVVDIMAGVSDLAAARAAFPSLDALSYRYWPYRDGMHWFCKPSPDARLFHLILIEPGHPEWKARLAFRDYLRENAQAASRYELLKRAAAAEHATDREAYTAAKSALVGELTACAIASGHPKA